MGSEGEAAISARFKAIEGFLDERMRRLVAAAEVISIGSRGVSLVARATGVSRRAITVGLRELDELQGSQGKDADEQQRRARIRRPGGGRKRNVDKDPTLLTDLEKLVEPVTRGDPESPLLWTCKSVRVLAEELRKKGHQASHQLVSELLAEQGYSLQANKKVIEGAQHPDRDAQFQHISQKIDENLAAGSPVISVDTKKKELVGDFKNAGRELRPKGHPEQVRVHDFLIPELGRATPYGVYDLANNLGWVSVGIDHDTASFAVETIRRWWKSMGQPLYPDAKHLLITADSGGSNGARLRLWKLELQLLANELGFPISVCHLPPGTSKWNRIEHRMFSFITQNWRGKPLVTHEVIVNLIAATKTRKGLKIKAMLDTNSYPAGRKVSDKEIASLNIDRDPFHGEWNYTLLPKPN
jgi:Rhodopirellula transposase DDE domain